jgi:DNA-binding response OmpR family regulator
MKILLVEDDPISAIAVQMLLTQLGHTVTIANDGAEGWRMLQSSVPDIIILDWMMPIMDGIAVCKKIKATPEMAKLCVVMLTAKRSREDRLEAMKAGVDVFLCKPLNKDDLVARLQIAKRIIEMDVSGDGLQSSTAAGRNFVSATNSF